MSYNFEATDDAYVITIPKSEGLPEDIEALFNYLRYDAIGRMNKITEADVLSLVKESRGAGIQRNKSWLKDVPGFEDLK